MENDIDKKIYNDYLNGEKQVFEILYKKYKNKVEFFIFNIVKDYQKAEDLAQETFMYIMQNKMKSNCSFKYYIYLVARSKALNFTNVENRRNEIINQYFSHNEDIEKDVLDTITIEETKNELLKFIELLDEKYKNAVYLTYIEKFSYKEISCILNVSITNVKNLVHRGKKQLRIIMLKKGFNEMNRISKICIILLCSIVLIGGFVYASSIIYNYIQKRGKTNYIEDMNLYFEVSENEMFYKAINSFEEYSKYKEKCVNIINATKDDFENSFVVVIIATWRMPEITIKNVRTDDSTLYITVDRKLSEESIDKEEYMVSTILPLEYYREKISVEIYETELSSDKYVRLEELPKEYPIEKAREDNCIIIDKCIMDENSEKKWNDFLQDTKDGKNSYIRIVLYSDDPTDILIRDLEYRNGEYFVKIDQTRSKYGDKWIKCFGNFTKLEENNTSGDYNYVKLSNIINETISIMVYK